jgi:hypothetical protein
MPEDKENELGPEFDISAEKLDYKQIIFEQLNDLRKSINQGKFQFINALESLLLLVYPYMMEKRTKWFRDEMNEIENLYNTSLNDMRNKYGETSTEAKNELEIKTGMRKARAIMVLLYKLKILPQPAESEDY